MTDHAIVTTGLARWFGRRSVLRDVALRVPRGGVFGLLGRNGAGKTTLIRILLGLVAPTRGAATVLGEDACALTPATRSRIGYLSESHPVHAGLRVRDHAALERACWPRWRDDVFAAVIARFRVDPAAKAKDLSRGQRAGLCLAQVLATDPDLLILDDPAIGLDPVARRNLLESMIALTRRADRTILFSTHLLGDVERVADRIAILDGGVLRANCPVDAFRERVRRYVLVFAGAPPPAPGVPGILESRRGERELSVTVANPEAGALAALRALNPVELREAPLPLEDAFIGYLGERGERTLIGDAIGGAA